MTTSVTLGTGEDRALYVFVRTNNVAVSSVTWNGVTSTPIESSLIDDTYWGHRLQWFQLLNPDSGTHDLVVNFASSAYASVFINSYAGVAQTGQPDAVATRTQLTGTSNYAPTINVQTNGSWVLAGTFTNYSDQAITSTDMTEREARSNAYTWDTDGGQDGDGAGASAPRQPAGDA